MRGARAAGALAAAVLMSMSVVATVPVHAAPSKDRYAIGDSVMLGARTALKDAGFRVDATESRQSYSGPALLRAKGAALPENVVVHLGTNGSFPLSTCKSIVRVAGPDRRVFLVNVYVPRSWQDSNNAVIRQCNEAFAADRVHVIDWKAAASANRGWFYSDRIHLRPAGAAGFARLVDDAVDRAVANAR